MGEIEKVRIRREEALANATDRMRLVGALETKIEDAKKLIASYEQQIEEHKAEAAESKKLADSIQDPKAQLEELKTKIQDAEGINAKVREKRRYNEILAEGKKARETLDGWDVKVKALRDERAKALTEAKFPVDGLAVDEAGGVTFKGVPIEQCATSEKIRIGLALASANDKMKVILIREGNDLDDDAMAAVLDFAKQNEIQIWIERIHAPEGGEGQTAVIISNGSNIGAEDADGDHTKLGKDDEPEKAPKKPKKQDTMF